MKIPNVSSLDPETLEKLDRAAKEFTDSVRKMGEAMSALGVVIKEALEKIDVKELDE